MSIKPSFAGRALLVGALALSSVAPSAAAATRGPELSTKKRLHDRRYTVNGTRAYMVGTESGRWPAMGFHTRGEMGGIWSPPIKLLDGIWFGIDDRWIGRATRFTSGYGYVRMRLPRTRGLGVTRTDFVPDRKRAGLIRLRLTNPGEAKTFTLKLDAHSELMGAYPWGETDPSQLDFNLTDRVRLSGGRLVFRERGRPHPSAEPHDWAAVVGSRLRPDSAATGAGFRGPQDPPRICPPSPDEAPDRCDDTAYGKGKGGRLRFRLRLGAGESRTLWFAVAGSERGPARAVTTFEQVIQAPWRLLRAKIDRRLMLGRRTRVSIPGDRLLQKGIEWSKQNLADSIQVARDLEIREVDAGTSYPEAEGRVPKVRFLGAGFPDYPWLFATDGEFTAFASVGVGQFGPIKDHLRALKAASIVDNGRSGKVVHEVVTDGSVYFGSNDDPGNTDETAKFPSAVALVWRWTGDNAFRDEMYRFTVRNMRYIFRELDEDRDGWPEGFGNVEREGMGEEKLDNTVYTIRGLVDLADMAKSKGDVPTQRWALRKAIFMRERFEQAWWMPRIPQHADSLDDPGNEKKQQRHWIGVTPMDAELVERGHAAPGLTTRRHGRRALNLRETRCYSGEFGLYHTGDEGCDPAVSDVPAERVIFTLNTAIMAVGEGNYGRLRPGQQARYTRANRRLQLPRPDEQPGAMPEIAPSPDYGRSIDRPFNERAQVLQAWGNYGTVWPVVHQQLGVRPDLGRGRLEVTPQLPPQNRRMAAHNVRLGPGSIDVRASRAGGTYRTVVHPRVHARLDLGHTISFKRRVTEVRLNGAPSPYTVRRTHRGKEVIVRAAPSGTQTLVVETRRT